VIDILCNISDLLGNAENMSVIDEIRKYNEVQARLLNKDQRSFSQYFSGNVIRHVSNRLLNVSYAHYWNLYYIHYIYLLRKDSDERFMLELDSVFIEFKQQVSPDIEFWCWRTLRGSHAD
jgi:hypothetical protein